MNTPLVSISYDQAALILTYLRKDQIEVQSHVFNNVRRDATFSDALKITNGIFETLESQLSGGAS